MAGGCDLRQLCLEEPLVSDVVALQPCGCVGSWLYCGKSVVSHIASGVCPFPSHMMCKRCLASYLAAGGGAAAAPEAAGCITCPFCRKTIGKLNVSWPWFRWW